MPGRAEEMVAQVTHICHEDFITTVNAPNRITVVQPMNVLILL
jgi:hypothetical protein